MSDPYCDEADRERMAKKNAAVLVPRELLAEAFMALQVLSRMAVSEELRNGARDLALRLNACVE